MKKYLFFILTMSLIFAACGSKQEATKDADTIRIGGLAPLSGPVAMYGTTATNGAILAVDEINEKGGVLGKKIEYNVLDEKGDSAEAVTAYNKLMEWGMVALIGDITSKPTIAVAELAVEDKMPMITPTGTHPSITEIGANIFRVCYTDDYQGKALANFAKNTLKANTVAVLVNNSSDYSDGIAKAFLDTSKEIGLEVVSFEGYADGDKDFKAQLTKLVSSQPDVLLVPDYYETAALIVTQAREVGLNSTFLGPDGWDGIAQALDPSAYADIENSYFTNHFSIKDDSERGKKFVQDYNKKFGEDPSAFSALAYDTVYLLVEAIEKAGSTEDKENITAKIKESNFSGITGQLTFDKSNNPLKTVPIFKVIGGDYTLDSILEF